MARIYPNNEAVDFERMWTEFERPTILLSPLGHYMYMSGEIVSKREDINTIPKGPEREKALDWFDKQKAPTVVEEVEEVLEPTPDLSDLKLNDLRRMAASKGLVKKEVWRMSKPKLIEALGSILAGA